MAAIRDGGIEQLQLPPATIESELAELREPSLAAQPLEPASASKSERA